MEVFIHVVLCFKYSEGLHVFMEKEDRDVHELGDNYCISPTYAETASFVSVCFIFWVIMGFIFSFIGLYLYSAFVEQNPPLYLSTTLIVLGFSLSTIISIKEIKK